MTSTSDKQRDDLWVAEIAKQVSEHIVAFREARGWKTGRLATEARLNYTSLQGWESGQTPPNLVALLKLTEAFELSSIEELLAGAPLLEELQSTISKGTKNLLGLRDQTAEER